MAFASSVVAETVVVAVTELQASLETAVMSRPARLAVARVSLRVATTLVVAVVGTFLNCTVCPTVVRGAETGAVIALAIRLIATLLAELD